jgi:hypothetical protein
MLVQGNQAPFLAIRERLTRARKLTFLGAGRHELALEIAVCTEFHGIGVVCLRHTDRGSVYSTTVRFVI